METTNPASKSPSAAAQALASSVATKEAFGRLYEIVTRLRSPEGCPWDREQTPASIRGNLLEEAYECVEAINDGEPAHIQEEIGDLYLLATMLTVMYEESGSFTTADSLGTISEKLIRRHPHVFGDSTADTPDAVIAQWNDIKEKVEGRRKKDSALDGVSRALPPLERAYKLQKAAAKVGFDWPDHHGNWDKLAEELEECRQVCTAPQTDQAAIEGELGDLLFSAVNVARRHHVDPAIALHRTIEKFSTRFRHVEKRMKESGQVMEPGKLEAMDIYWDEAKSLEQALAPKPSHQ
jgi:tetrapyrrole methylase family protein/MazG family protein